ncbi:hypothetical protein ACWIG5_20785 [Streptomyces lydicus]
MGLLLPGLLWLLPIFTIRFRAAVRAATHNGENDMRHPHPSQDLITKYVADHRSQHLL